MLLRHTKKCVFITHKKTFHFIEGLTRWIKIEQ